MPLPPLLAADPGTWITLIFVILGFLGWIMNLAGNKTPPPPARGGRPPGQPPRPVPRNRDERIQNEIDIFLQEVGGKKSDRPKPSGPPPRPAAEEERSRPRVAPLSRTSSPPQPSSPPTAILLEEAPAETERRRVAPSELGSAVREHVSQSMEHARLEPHVKAHVAHLVERAVEHQVGKLTHEDTQRLTGGDTPRLATAAAHPLVQALRNPASVRQAILMSEILGPPPSMR